MISLFLLFKERKGIKTKDDNADSHRTTFPPFQDTDKKREAGRKNAHAFLSCVAPPCGRRTGRGRRKGKREKGKRKEGTSPAHAQKRRYLHRERRFGRKAEKMDTETGEGAENGRFSLMQDVS